VTPKALAMRLTRLPALAALLLSMTAWHAAAGAAPGTRVLAREAVIAEFSDSQSRFIDIDGVNLHYKDQGSGPPLLLVHGTLGDLSDWDDWAALLAKRHRVLRVDLPGFGLSGPIASGNYSVDRMLALIDGFMDQVGAPRFAIAGISYGGLVAFRYAATRGERVDALVVINSAGVEYGRGPAGQTGVPASSPAPAPSAASAPPTNVFMDDVITEADIRVNIEHMLVHPALATPRRVQRKLAFANIRGRGEESRAGRALYERGDPARVMAHVHAPTLVLWGGGNKALDPRTADVFVSYLKNACRTERRIYPDAGHLLILDAATQSATDTLNFLDGPAHAAPCRDSAAPAVAAN
jgi:pimeloyl-ACP methyl ester carboxylesterase